MTSVVVALTSVGLGSQASPQNHQTLISEYRRGDAEAIVAKVAAMGPIGAERLQPIGTVEDAPWDWAASILLRAEARRRYYTLGHLGLQRGSDLDPYVVEDLWQTPSLRALRALLDHAMQSADERLLDYCREWFIAALHGSSREFFDASRSLFPRDVQVLIARGRWQEYRMGPETEEAGPGAIWLAAGAVQSGTTGGMAREELMVRTAHGRFASETAQRAIDTYRDALEIEPGATEARLRLGRVLFLLDHNDDALRELQRTLADARTQSEVGTAYLAALFAGQAQEFEERPTDAAALYREAIALCPKCPAAALALLQLQVTTGQAADGWHAVSDLFGHADTTGAVAADPWAMYTIRPDSFLQAQRYVALRRWIRTQ